MNSAVHIIFFQQIGDLKLEAQSIFEETLVEAHRYIQRVDAHVHVLYMSFGVISAIYIKQESRRKGEAVTPHKSHPWFAQRKFTVFTVDMEPLLVDLRHELWIPPADGWRQGYRRYDVVIGFRIDDIQQGDGWIGVRIGFANLNDIVFYMVVDKAEIYPFIGGRQINVLVNNRFQKRITGLIGIFVAVICVASQHIVRRTCDSATIAQLNLCFTYRKVHIQRRKHVVEHAALLVNVFTLFIVVEIHIFVSYSCLYIDFAERA